MPNSANEIPGIQAVTGAAIQLSGTARTTRIQCRSSPGHKIPRLLPRRHEDYHKRPQRV